MSDSFLLYSVFASQIFIISYLLPTKLRQRAQGIMRDYPPEEYNKLYPIAIDEVINKINGLVVLSRVIIGLGAGVIAYGVYSKSSEMLGWDSQSVIMIYYMLQVTPLVILTIFSERYLKKMRRINQNNIRKAQLTPRRISNYVSRALITTTAGVYLAFVVLVAYINEHPFEGFAGYINVLGVTGLNVFFGFFVYKAIYGRKKDPHQTDEDRFKQARRIVQLMFFSSIAATVNISSHFILSSMDMRHLNDVVSSLYYQALMLVVIFAVLKDDANFEAYKNTNNAAGEE